MHKYVKHSSLRYRLSRNIRTLVSYTEEKTHHDRTGQTQEFAGEARRMGFKKLIHHSQQITWNAEESLVVETVGCVSVCICECMMEKSGYANIRNLGVVIGYVQKQRDRSLYISNLQCFQMLCLILTGVTLVFDRSDTKGE